MKSHKEFSQTEALKTFILLVPIAEDQLADRHSGLTADPVKLFTDDEGCDFHIFSRFSLVIFNSLGYRNPGHASSWKSYNDRHRCGQGNSYCVNTHPVQGTLVPHPAGVLVHVERHGVSVPHTDCDWQTAPLIVKLKCTGPSTVSVIVFD